MKYKIENPCEGCRCMLCKHENDRIDGLDCCLVHPMACPNGDECEDFEPMDTVEVSQEDN